ncbi:bifunctional 3-(3-hydroxy-phenyl)propionate/3-hydroxycinnamic acid hydroxylase [Streptomyces bohaiensis]|nr:bifunctional 3-(3-hydroxy-phenyl)propionate/3-hydroxycinnamic acid hydroxylase [Streptomyces bohaiensis]
MGVADIYHYLARRHSAAGTDSSFLACTWWWMLHRPGRRGDPREAITAAGQGPAGPARRGAGTPYDVSTKGNSMVPPRERPAADGPAPAVSVGPAASVDPERDADVLVVGYGPVGQLLSLLLADRGLRVAAVEQWPRPYPLPRAVAYDGQAARALDAVGVGEELAPVTEPSPDYVVTDAAGRALLRVPLRADGRHGRPDSTSVHQPRLEAALTARGERLPGLRVHRGYRAVGLTASDSAVELVAEAAADGAPRRLTASWVVGCDGANSFVQRELGGEVDDFGFALDWMACDVVPHRPAEFPPRNDQVADPARPRVAVSSGPGHRRWEFMRLPGEDVDTFATEDHAWRLLAGFGVTPENAALTRHAVYTFAGRNARRWRRGRVLLAGDAAHQMPPFAGQGMCSGFRDAVGLAWRLALVVRGRADAALLDDYVTERRAQVRHSIDLSVRLGRLICVTDPEAAAARDRSMLGQAPPEGGAPGAAPGIGDELPGETLAAGFLFGGGGAPAGRLVGQARLTGPEGTDRADAVLGDGFVLLCREDPAALADAEALALLRELGGRAVRVLPADGTEGADGADSSGPGAGTVRDTDGAYLPWLAELGAVAALLRPDHYLYGAAGDAAGVGRLLADLRERLAG